jgi:amino acid adenylation domain-containing protein
MSTTAEFLERLTALDVRVWLDGEHLRVSAPAGALDGGLREELRTRKQELREALGVRAATAIAPPSENDAPLSASQQRIWFFQQLEPGSSVYNIGAVFALAGPLDVAALEASVGAIVARHEILRSTYSERDGEPRIDVHPPAPWKLTLADLSGSDGEAVRAEAEELRKKEQARPFDLGKDFPLRTLLVRLSPELHHLVVTFHHIAADGTSVVIFARELAAHYTAKQGGNSAALPDMVQYPELARRERAWLSSEGYNRTLEYWKEQLAGDLPPITLPLDSPRPAIQTFRGDAVETTLPEAWGEPLRALGRRRGATLAMTLLTAFDAVLHRHSGDTDILIGLPVANRDRAETRDPIGMFVNTVVVRADASGNPSFADLLTRVRQSTIGALAHQELPFARLVEEVRPQRDLSRTPLFQVMFNMFTMEVEDEIRAGNLRIAAPPADASATNEVDSKFDLTLYVQERAGGINCVLAYNADLFARERMERLMRHFERILESALADDNTRIGDVALEPAAVTERVPHAMRPGAFTPLSPDFSASSIAARFHEVAGRNADRTAIVAPDGSWTYAELERNAKRIAAALDAASGGKPGRVALLCGRGANMVAAILGVLNRGAAYVPLDPSFPEARLSALLDDAEATMILAEPQFVPLARAVAGEGRAVVSTDAAEAGADSIEAPGVPSGTAYVLYTSGSSGRPKGVAQTNENVLSYVRAYINALELTPGDRMTLVASYTFDASVVDIFSALMAGATLYPLDVRAKGVHEIAREIQDARITVCHSTPTLYRALIPHLDAASVANVRAIVLGGEKVFAADVDAFRNRFADGAVFVNLYGATEVTIALMGMFTRAAAPREQAVSVGVAIPGLDVVLLDETGAETPVRGEIAVRGRHVAPGYWNAPDVTHAAFSEPDAAGIRSYRTGDLAVRRPDGRFDVLGRRDFQVKIRGLRIEPGEVEMVLRAHPAVREGVVVADASDPANPVIIAFATLVASGVANSAALQAHLAAALPEYMLPSAVVLLPELPLTRTGKVDRRALPTAHELGLDARADFVAPRDAVEEMLAEVWSDVLGRANIGVHDNFFALGGHSLNATQVISRLRSTAGVEIPLRALFIAPTIAAMAAFIRDASSKKALDDGPRLRPLESVSNESPLSFSQERMWYMQQLIPDGTAYNMSAASLVTGPLDRNALIAALGDLRARHQMLRTTFAAPAGDPRQFLDAAPDTVPVIDKDFSSLPAAEALEAARSFAADIALEPFDLERGPLWRVILARIAPDKHVIVIVMHHIIGDLWSFGVISREFGTLYRARSSGADPRLSPLDVQYTDYSHWQREWLSGSRLDEQLRYWTTRLAGLSPLELPTDRPRPAVVTSNGNRRRHEIGGDVVRRVRLLGSREGVTPFMTFFATFAAVLYRYTEQTDIGIGVPIANRTQLGLEGLVGTFVNTLVHRNDLSGAPTFRELLRRVRATALDAFAHQDLPFERLVRELAPERDASRSPVFQVLFNMANAAPPAPESVGGMEVAPVDIDRRAAQFELALGVFVGETVTITAGYNTDLFDEATIERFLRSYATFTSAAIRDPDRPITEIELMSAEEQAELIETINDTEAPVPPETVVSIFEKQAATAPDTPALEYGDETLTYAELDARVNQMAHTLIARGVAPGDLVGVCLPRTPDVVVSMLAVLKTGAAYVPIDVRFPAQRVQYMLADSGARLVIADEESGTVEPGARADDLFVDRDRATIEAASRERPGVSVPLDARAYVIYTSGSTGQPKGVEITHDALINFLASMQRAPGIAAREAILAVTTVSFDIAGLELYLPLVAGATIVLAARDVAGDGRLLRQLLEERKPNLMQATPATWRALIDSGWTSSPQLKALCGGEALPRDLANELLARVGELWNMYGPTETTIWSTIHRVTGTGVIPVGRPIANTRVYILDPRGKPLPPGVPGELFIGGAGVARGYFNRPELTQERFLRDPFDSRPGARMYRTGDRARFLADGTIEHLGRLDNQIKLRGFRIELGEIESALATAPGVRECAVDVRQDRLTAFVVFESGRELTATEVRSHLRQSLPDYMIPSLVVPMEKIPLTPNGKVDRRALPDALRNARAEAVFQPPNTPTEIAIATIWKELLGVPRVSTTDNFFELGGHSLLSMKAVHEIQVRTGWRPDARSLFFQSLGQIAATRPGS